MEVPLHGADGTAQQIKVLATKHNTLSLIPETSCSTKRTESNKLFSGLTHTHTHIQNVIFKMFHPFTPTVFIIGFSLSLEAFKPQAVTAYATIYLGRQSRSMAQTSLELMALL